MARGRNEDVMDLIKKYIKHKHGNEPFPNFKTGNEFFQYLFETTLDLNAFKNLTSHIKEDPDFEFVGKFKNKNYFKLRD